MVQKICSEMRVIYSNGLGVERAGAERVES
nr:MAG TPA: hypothetical protein [Caudoviricetes sp.]